MGATLANLHIRRISNDEAEKLVPDSLTRQFDNEWSTITSENFQAGNMAGIGRRLSKKTEHPILSAEVLDDDLLILNVFKQGKNVASHVSGSEYGYMKKNGSPDAFVKGLELPDNYAEYIKYALECEDLRMKMQLLEKILGIPLYVDYKMLSELQLEYDSPLRDLDFVENYIKEKKISEKIKNAAKAKLLMEFDGQIYKNLGSDKYFIHRPSADGNYYTSKEHFIYGISSEGKLVPLFDISSYNFEFGENIITNKKVIAIFENVIYDNVICESNISLLDLKGILLGKTTLTAKAAYPLLVFEDGGIILSNNNQKQVISEYGIDGLKRWELHAEYLDVNPVYYGGHIYLYYTDFGWNKSALLKISRSGDVLKSLDLKLCGGAHWNTFKFDKNGNFYFCARVNGDKETDSDKIFYIDSNLNILNEQPLNGASFEGILDSDNNRLFIPVFEKELVAFNTEQNVIYSRKKYAEALSLCSADKKGRLVISKGMSTVEVFDTELNIISRHRLKGIIVDKYMNDEGNACIITSQMPSGAFLTDNVKSVMRVYEIL